MGYTIHHSNCYKNAKDVFNNEILPYCNIKENYHLTKAKGGFWLEGHYKENNEHFIIYIKCTFKNQDLCYKYFNGIDTTEIMPQKYLKMLDLTDTNTKRYYDYAIKEIQRKQNIKKNYPSYKSLKNGDYLNITIGTELNIGNITKMTKGDKITGIWRDNRIYIPSYNAMIRKNQIKRFCSKVEILLNN